MKNKITHILSIFSIVIFTLLAIGSSDIKVEPDPITAYVFAESFIKERLKSPSTAMFPSVMEKQNHVTDLGNDEYKINSWVDSQNGFGAMLRTKWSCTIKFIDDEVQVNNIIIQ
jgi:hypothetical protein